MRTVQNMTKGSNYIHVNAINTIMNIGEKEERIKFENKKQAENNMRIYNDEKEAINKR